MKCEEVDLIGFLESDLDASQTSSVAEHLQGCTECQDRLRLVLEMRKNRKALERLKPAPKSLSYAWPIAAGLLLVALVGYWYSLNHQDVTKLAVVTPYPMVPPELRSPRPQDEFLAAARAYGSGNWSPAEDQLRQYLKSHPEDYEAMFYLANALCAQNKLSESEAILTKLETRNPQDNRVRWLLANLSLRRRDIQATRSRLDAITHSSGEFHDEAAALLSKLPR